ncbi:unnamed protein product [Adineta ricciae]|uniref:Uncharacterized protein n=1 Tax=Adineta ricciae TaxID=249248 RepID=A0A815UE40_ADIRI|nr:unnamed protein product [Adineta ricciae]
MSSLPNKTTTTTTTTGAATTPVVYSKFVNASQLLASVKSNMNIESEDISDQELLEMAIMFEKEHPECVSTVTK